MTKQNTRREEYGTDWNRKRKRVMARDKQCCVDCWKNHKRVTITKLAVHHIVPRAEGGSNEEDNLVTLCSECHGRRHGWRPTVGEEGWPVE